MINSKNYFQNFVFEAGIYDDIFSGNPQSLWGLESFMFIFQNVLKKLVQT